MLSPKQLIASYEILSEKPVSLIRFPTRFFLRAFGEFLCLFLIASVMAYDIMSIVTVFLYLYIPFTAYLFSRIWCLFGLSRAKLYITLAVFFIATLPLGPFLRELFLITFGFVKGVI